MMFEGRSALGISAGRGRRNGRAGWAYSICMDRRLTETLRGSLHGGHKPASVQIIPGVLILRYPFSLPYRAERLLYRFAKIREEDRSPSDLILTDSSMPIACEIRAFPLIEMSRCPALSLQATSLKTQDGPVPCLMPFSYMSKPRSRDDRSSSETYRSSFCRVAKL